MENFKENVTKNTKTKSFEKYTLVKNIYRNSESFFNKTIQVSGWVRKLRISKNFGFIELNDGSFFNGLQIVVDQNLKNFDEVSHLSLASSPTLS